MDVAGAPSTPQTHWLLHPPSSQQETPIPNAKHQDNTIAEEEDQLDLRQTSSSFDSVVSDQAPSSSLHSNETSVHNEVTTQWILRDNETESDPSDEETTEAPRRRLIKVNLTDASPSAALRSVPTSSAQTIRISSKENFRQNSYWGLGRIVAAFDSGNGVSHRAPPKFDLAPVLPNQTIHSSNHDRFLSDHHAVEERDEQMGTPHPNEEPAIQICSQGPRSPGVVVTGPTSARSAKSIADEMSESRRQTQSAISDHDRPHFASRASARTLTSPSTSPRLWLSRNVSPATIPPHQLSTPEVVEPSRTSPRLGLNRSLPSATSLGQHVSKARTITEKCEQLPSFDMRSELNAVPMRFEDDQIIIYYSAEILPIFPDDEVHSKMISFQCTVGRTGIPNTLISLKRGEQDVIPEMSYWALDSPSATLTLIRPREDAARPLNVSLAIVYPLNQEGTLVPAPYLHPKSGTLISERIVVHQPTLPLVMKPSMRPTLSTWTTEARDENVLVFERSGLLPRLFPGVYVDHVRLRFQELQKASCANSQFRDCFRTTITRMKLRIAPMFGGKFSCTMKLQLMLNKAERVLVINPSGWTLADWLINGRIVFDSDAWRIDEDGQILLIRNLLPQDLATEEGMPVDIEIRWEMSGGMIWPHFEGDIHLKLPAVMGNEILRGWLSCGISSAAVTLRNQAPGSTLRTSFESQIALGSLHEDYDLRLTIPWSYASSLTQSSPQNEPTTEPTRTDPPESGADTSGENTGALSDIPEESSSLDGATLNEAPLAPQRSRSGSRRRNDESPSRESPLWLLIKGFSWWILFMAVFLGLIWLLLYILARLGFVSPYIGGVPVVANGTTMPDTTPEYFDSDLVGDPKLKREDSEFEEDEEVIRKARIRQHEQAKAAEAKHRVNEVFGSVAYHNAFLSKSAKAQKEHKTQKAQKTQLAHGHGGRESVPEAAARERWYEHVVVEAGKKREDEEMKWLAKWDPIEWRRRKQAEKHASLNKEATEELERYGSQFPNHDKMLRPPIKKRTLRDRIDAMIGWAWLVY